MELAGLILDIYDDHKGLVLRKKLAGGTEMPPKLASSTLLDVESRDRLPDRLFAMVATNHGSLVRKYAMNDEAHVVTSLLYFDECGHLLPEIVRAKVAANLLLGCSWHEISPPESLVKTAMLGAAINTALSAADSFSQARQVAASEGERGRANLAGLRAAQASGAKVASGRDIRLTPEQDAAMQRGEGPEAGYIFGALAQFSNHDKTHKKLDHQLAPGEAIDMYGKQADLNGTEVMPVSGSLRNSNPRPSPLSTAVSKKASLAEKVAALVAGGWIPVGDITRLGTPVTVKTASATSFALPHIKQYPIDTIEQVKRAEAYFDLHVGHFSYQDRRFYAQSVLERAEELGVKVAGSMLLYGGQGYGPFIDAELHARCASFVGTGNEAIYEVLLEKRAETSPAVMADMLKIADEETGADRSYGRPGVGLRDPYAAVYGSAKTAEAQPSKEDMYSWRSGGDYVNGTMLTALASRRANLDSAFGAGFGVSFAKDPVGIFESMPDPQKVVLSRLASDNISQVFRV